MNTLEAPARVSESHETVLKHFLTRLIDQQQAQVIVPPQDTGPGFWFGGGNAVEDAAGIVWVVGRYRNFGDSRTGVSSGARGLELALFRSEDRGRSFRKAQHWSKADLSYDGREVVSIEGAALYLNPAGGAELYVSTEKDVPYPASLEEYRKPGTGVWSIDLMTAVSIEALDTRTLRSVLHTAPPPEYLHVKDPVVFPGARGETLLLFADHPFTWSAMNTGYAVRAAGGASFECQSWELVRRGPAWDVAGTRITSRLMAPRLGQFREAPPLAFYFYDGLECYRSHEQNTHAVQRPRGYSCEELGGVMYGAPEAFPQMTRLSRLAPMFVSPHGTGCSRYVDVLALEDGLLATWQQSQPDKSQPLVARFLPNDEIEELLS